MAIKNSKSNMVYTPERHIPIGEALKTSSGEYAIRLKKNGENEYEIISIGQLLNQVAQIVESQMLRRNPE